MPRSRTATIALSALLLVCTAIAADMAHGQEQRVPLQLFSRSGNPVFPAVEGWYRNPDGRTTFLVGYYNRNEVTLDIPIGPNNHMDPGGPDLGQPTHFLPRRQYGVFAVTVPKDFGNKRLTWTINAFGQVQTVPLWINAPYVIDPFRNPSDGNTPPRVRFAPTGPEVVAVPLGIAKTYETRVRSELELPVWAQDEGRPAGVRGGANPAAVTWSKYRGVGETRFSPPVVPFVDGVAKTRVSFTAVGEYWLRAQVNDASGIGGSGQQCCWTNAHVRVIVR